MTLLCRTLGVHRSAYYLWEASRAARLAVLRAEELLAAEIALIHAASRGAYGAPRVHAELRRRGRQVNRKKVERIMRERGIAGITRRRRGLSRPERKAVFAPDLIGRDFTAIRPGMRIVGDITYLPTEQGWLYLACWMDLATREIVGWSMAEHHRAELVIDALRMAVGRGGLEPGCIAHSDRRSEYTSAGFRAVIAQLGLRQSMGRTGSCYDNAACESLWAVLKEEIGTRTWPDQASARTEVFEFIEAFYNRKRLRRHPEFGYLTPLETRERLRQQHTLAAQDERVQLNGGTSPPAPSVQQVGPGILKGVDDVLVDEPRRATRRRTDHGHRPVVDWSGQNLKQEFYHAGRTRDPLGQPAVPDHDRPDIGISPVDEPERVIPGEARAPSDKAWPCGIRRVGRRATASSTVLAKPGEPTSQSLGLTGHRGPVWACRREDVQRVIERPHAIVLEEHLVIAGKADAPRSLHSRPVDQLVTPELRGHESK